LRLLHSARRRCGTPPRSTAEHAQCAGHRRYFRWSLLPRCVAQPSALHQGRGCVQSISPEAQVCHRGFATPRHLRRQRAHETRRACCWTPLQLLGAEQRTGVLCHSECNVVLAASALLSALTVSSTGAVASACKLSRAQQAKTAHQVQADMADEAAQAPRVLAIK